MGNEKYANFDGQMRIDFDIMFRLGADRTQKSLISYQKGYADPSKQISLNPNIVESELEELESDIGAMTKVHQIYQNLYNEQNGDFLKQEFLAANAKKTLKIFLRQ